MSTKLSLKYLESLSAEQRKTEIIKEYFKCSQDPKYCIETYFTVVGSSGDRIPFKLYPHQLDALQAYEDYSNLITMKTRQMGFTTFTAAYIFWKCIFNNNYITTVISKTQKDAVKFLKDIKGIIYDVQKNHPWLCGELVKDTVLNLEFKNGSNIQGESTTENSGRGGTYDLAVVDEVAFIDRKSPEKMKELWSALSPALAKKRGKAIMISTPKGASGWYYDTYTNSKKMGFHIIDAHWSKHPDYSQGLYQWIIDESKPGGGYIKHLTDKWCDEIFDKETGKYIPLKIEEYNFICDGKIRSPWYDLNSAKLGPRLTKCELDCSFAGTGGEVLDSDMLREMKIIADNFDFYNPYGHLKGAFQSYREFESYNPDHKYVITADVSTGDGNDFSTAVVFNLTTFRIAGSFKDNILPNIFAKVLFTLGRDFGNAVLAVENQGGGFTTLQSLKSNNYPHIYYSTLNKKDPTTGMKKRKIGLWASEEVRMQGGDKLEEYIRMRELEIPCTMMIEEFYTWIWDKDGRRRHAPEKHDDLIMALQHAIWYSVYVYKRSERNRNNFQNIFSIQRNNQTITLSNNLHGRGSFVKSNGPMKERKSTHQLDNIDKGLDPRILSYSELEQQYKRKFFI